MTGFCLEVAALVQLAIATPQLTVAWAHSVEKVRWEEDYRIEGERLRAAAARVRGFGAGMEVPEGARWRDGAWEYRPNLLPLERLTLTRSSFTADYQLCWEGECRTLTDLLGQAADGSVVEVFACPQGRLIPRNE